MEIMKTLRKMLGAEPAQPIPNLGRNQICWCGSGKKYKNCHLSADDRKRASLRKAGPASTGRGF